MKDKIQHCSSLFLPALLTLSIYLFAAFFVSGRPLVDSQKNIKDKSDTSSVHLLFMEDTMNTAKIEAIYGICFYKNGFIFAMNSRNKYDLLADYIPYGQSDTYFTKNSSRKMSDATFFISDFPFPYQPGSFTFSEDYHTLLFTKPVSEGAHTPKIVGIYETKYKESIKKKESGWDSQFTLLPFCKGGFCYMQPALSHDGKLLVFSTDLSGSKAGLNLFYVVASNNGWSEPIALSPPINSDGNELYPFLDNANNLYFSSDRKEGYGGYDIYVARFNGKSWDNPVNLGEEVNTADHELMFKLNRNDASAVYISENPDMEATIRYMKSIMPAGMKIQQNLKTGDQKTTPAQVSKTSVAPASKKEPLPPPTVTVEKKSEQKTTQQSTVKQAQKTTTTIETPTVKNTTIASSKKTVTEPEPIPIVFRVQLISSTKSKGDFTIKIGQTEYHPFEYYYKGAYRYTVGEFNNVKDAVQLSNLCRKEGYSQAFVIALQGKKRILDPSVFKR